MMWMRFRSVLPVILVLLLVMAAVSVAIVPNAGADDPVMVVAPSRIIVSSSGNTENYKLNNDSDNTVKAIIDYPLEVGAVVDEESFDIAMTFIVDGTIVGTIDALSLRYCYTDDNLIIEFDRQDVVNALLEEQGLVNVEVNGSFYVVGDSEGIEIDLFAAILVNNPRVAK